MTGVPSGSLISNIKRLPVMLRCSAQRPLVTVLGKKRILFEQIIDCNGAS